MDRVLDFVERYSPDLHELLLELWREGAIEVDREAQTVRLREAEADEATRARYQELAAALATVRSFPEPSDLSQVQGPVSVILCGGRGTRMRSREKHKVCFPVRGRAAINRALDAYEQAGIPRHVVVVGVLGEQVVEEVTGEHEGVDFVYQLHPRGTGNAAKQAAAYLERQLYDGDVLVVAGDKVIDPRAVRNLYAAFKERDADLAVSVAPKERWPDSGRIVFRQDGSLHSTIEARDVARARVLSRILREKEASPELGNDYFLGLIREAEPRPDRARLMFGELLARLEAEEATALPALRALIRPEDTQFAITESDGSTTVLTPEQLEEQTSKVNVSLYLFKARALYDALRHIAADNAQQEEYLTDAVGILGNARRPDGTLRYKLISVDVDDPNWVLAYNNPEELLEIEDYLRRQEAIARGIRVAEPRRPRRTVGEWLTLFDAHDPRLAQRFAEIYGDDPALHRERHQAYRDVLLEFARVYGLDCEVLIIRSPGRVNLMGRHVDHRGGHNNLMAIDKEVLMVVEEREDNNVALHNLDFRHFKFRTFNIGEEVASLEWDDWLSTINSEKVIRMVREAGGDWANYIKAAALRLQEQFRDRRVRGMNVMVSGNIPMGAGLSSSSAMVVAAAEAICEVNALAVTAHQFVALCGEGEWFVGTRGGSGDHAAIKLARRGAIAHVKFYPFAVESIVPFPQGYRLVVCASGIEAKKAENARDIFNQCIAAYEAGCLVFRSLLPGKADRIEYLRDVNPHTLECSQADVLRLVRGLPDRIGRDELRSLLRDQDTAQLEKLFLSHGEPPDGYRLRGVCLFGITECLRSRDCVDFLERGDVDGFGRLMTVSHDGDRVSRLDPQGRRQALPLDVPDQALETLVADCEAGHRSLLDIPGSYACSTPELDAMVDIALGIEGVAGAQLAGAGLGGCIMVLAREDATEALRKALVERYYGPAGREPRVEVCVPVQGSGVFEL
ncbi:MAG: NTP transferase domain-containing protein [Candidatus Brocadiia bacterium]